MKIIAEQALEKAGTQLSTVVKTLSPYTVTFNEILNLAKYLSVSLKGKVIVLLLTYRTVTKIRSNNIGNSLHGLTQCRAQSKLSEIALP